MKKNKQSESNGLRKAAILLTILGDEAAGAIYRKLPEEDVQQLTQEIVELDYISPEQASQVLEDYHRLSLTQEYLAQGGTAYAAQLLVKAFGKESAKSLLAQAEETQEARSSNLDSLRRADPQQLAKFMESEHPQTVALVLAHLGVQHAVGLLKLLPHEMQAQVVARLAEMQQFSPETAKMISLVLHNKLQSLGEQNRRAYAGVEAVADLMNRLDLSTSKSTLGSIEQVDSKLALAIRNAMFIFEDLLSVPDVSIRELLGQVDKKTLAIALKGAPEDLKNHLFKSMSSRAAQMLKEDMEVLGPIRAREVVTAQQEIVNLARKLEAEGKLILKPEMEEELVV